MCCKAVFRHLSSLEQFIRQDVFKEGKEGFQTMILRACPASILVQNAEWGYGNQVIRVLKCILGLLTQRSKILKPLDEKCTLQICS